MPRTSNTAPVGVVVIGAGVRGSFDAESIANFEQAKPIAVVDPAEKQAKAVARRPLQPSLDEALSSLRVSALA